jgi:phosphatidylglycerophosphate synthase
MTQLIPNSAPVPAYEPTSRRPIAGLFRRTAAGAVNWCVRHRVHPDTVSYLSMVAAAAAGVCFWLSDRRPWLTVPMLLLSPAFCYARLWMNMLDGMVAIASGKASLRGEILNDLPDRVSDVLIFAGVAHSRLCSPFTAYWAAIFALLTAYVGMFGQAVSTHREFSGVMSKPWRMVALHVGAWLTLITFWTSSPNPRPGGLTILDWTCLVVIAGCVQTIWVRLARIMRALEAQKRPTPGR